MYCTKCGRIIEDSSVFCGSCGYQVKVVNKRNNSIIRIIGTVLSLIGIAMFIIISLVGLTGYGKIYFFNGYSYTKVLCIIAMILMTLGFILIPVSLIVNRQSIKKKQLIVCITAIILSISFSIILLINAINSNKRSSYSNSSSYSTYSSHSSNELSHSTYCTLYMKVSNVRISHRGSYTYCTGTITNTGTYQIKFVRVKGVFKDRYGQVIDTDWTYAVDSSWLDPGESNSFEMMIKDESGKISTADVSVIID